MAVPECDVIHTVARALAQKQRNQVSSFEACKDIAVGNEDIAWVTRMGERWELEPPNHWPEIVAAISDVKPRDRNTVSAMPHTQRGAAARGLASIPLQQNRYT